MQEFAPTPKIRKAPLRPPPRWVCAPTTPARRRCGSVRAQLGWRWCGRGDRGRRGAGPPAAAAASPRLPVCWVPPTPPLPLFPLSPLFYSGRGCCGSGGVGGSAGVPSVFFFSSAVCPHHPCFFCIFLFCSFLASFPPPPPRLCDSPLVFSFRRFGWGVAGPVAAAPLTPPI